MLRPFNTADLPRIAELWLETNVRAHDFVPESYWRGNLDAVREMLPEATIFVWEENRVIAGFIGLSDSYIAGIFVDATHQSRGVGRRLLDYVKVEHDKLVLRVYRKNVRARAFYKREGFVEVSESVDEATGEVEVMMEWERG
ncbi:GNAT family N-acetyltransferase [Paenalkalicoccus suaedae]|uniref:GNAT family N-acetyltransferase n=2 Tax=Paenalkalicoccus suaedae TaxID=2592382 RepID=A0A859FKM4_9BACI|nr:GNAT family N-acetyltransferase [Paenalkalicoccus suaedae]